MIDLKRKIRKKLILHQGLLHCLLLLDRELIVTFLHMDFSTLIMNILHNLRKLLSSHCNHLNKKGCCIDTVLAIDVTMYRQTSGRLSSDDCTSLCHLC